MIKSFIEASIFIDKNAEVLYGEDEAYDSCPMHFATVTFELYPNTILESIANAYRLRCGFNPCNDSHAWYEFYIGVNDVKDGVGRIKKVDSYIRFYVCNSCEDDNEEYYGIGLTDEERDIIYQRLCDESFEKTKMTMEEHFEEARKRMK